MREKRKKKVNLFIILIFGRCSPTMTFNAGLVICYCFVGLVHFVCAGPLDAALNWARADKLPIEIDVNLPWLPCKYQIHLTVTSFKIYILWEFFLFGFCFIFAFSHVSRFINLRLPAYGILCGCLMKFICRTKFFLINLRTKFRNWSINENFIIFFFRKFIHCPNIYQYSIRASAFKIQNEIEMTGRRRRRNKFKRIKRIVEKIYTKSKELLTLFSIPNQ